MYIAAGLRTLEEHGLSDSYLTVVLGLAPVAGLGRRLQAVRPRRRAASGRSPARPDDDRHDQGNRQPVGARPLLQPLILPPGGQVLMLAHLAVYDTLAVAGVATSFWC